MVAKQQQEKEKMQTENKIKMYKPRVVSDLFGENYC